MSQNEGKETKGFRVITKTQEDIVNIPIVREEMSIALDNNEIFKPSKDMVKLKSRFLSRVKMLKLDIQTIALEDILKYIPKNPSLINWWKNEMFQEWFRNANAQEEQLDYLLSRTIDNLTEIIENDEGIYSARDRMSAQKQLVDIRNSLSIERKQVLEETKSVDVKQMAAKMFAELNREENKAKELKERTKQYKLPE